LEQFLSDLLEPLGRRERRQWGSVYVQGLLLDGERKSIEPMAARLPDGNVQALQQMIGQSPWAWAPVWQRLAQRMAAELAPAPVWVIDDTGFLKQGRHSVGVARQYSGTLGKTANCQVAVSLHQVGADESAVLDWRLYLPESWTQDAERRAQAGIPAEVKFQSKWQVATGTGADRRGAGLELAVWGGVGRRRLRGSQGISPGVGDPPTSLCPGHSFHGAGMDQTTPPAKGAGARTSGTGLPLRRAAALRGGGSSGSSPWVEASALAKRHERLAGIALLRASRPTRARIR
jgi:DDE superfamily endonuclease